MSEVLTAQLVITEESIDVLNQWKEDARKMTMEELPEFLRKLTQDYSHDYGTICHALAAGAVATAHAMNQTPQGGITGFQAGAIMWEFIKGWDTSKALVPLRLLDYSAMLFPQNMKNFTTISGDSFKWLQEKAQANIEMNDKGEEVAPSVRAHWGSIVAGDVPFGFKLNE